MIKVWRGSIRDKSTFGWEAAEASDAGSTITYQVIRGTIGQWPVGTGAGETCIEPGTAATSITDGDIPDQGNGYFYLTRARNVCGVGTYGTTSSGAERISSTCP